MRPSRALAFAAWLIIATLAVAGFAAFTPAQPNAPWQASGDTTPVDTTSPDPNVDAGVAAGRMAALGFVATQSEAGLADPSVQPAIDALIAARLAAQATTTTTTAPRRTTTTRPTTTTTSPPVTAPPTTTAATAAPTTIAPAPTEDPGGGIGLVGVCKASWYGPGFQGRRTASGEIFDTNQLTAATHYVPFGTWITVRRADTGATVTVRINDRGPYVWTDGGWARHPTRCIDLSQAAMEAIAGLGAGVVSVILEMPADTPGLDRLQGRYGIPE